MRRISCKHLVEHAREAVDVAASVDFPVACRLLRTHVLRRAKRQPALRYARATGVADRESDSEIRDDRLAGAEQNVLGLEVAMYHSVAMRVVERAGAGSRDANGLLDGKLLLALESMANRFALDVRHDVIEPPVRLAGVK